MGLMLIVLMASGTLMAATDERPMLVRVKIDQPQAVAFLRSGGFDIAYVASKDFADIVADDSDFLRLAQAGLNPEIVHSDLVAFYQSRYPLGSRMGGFLTFPEVLAFMDSIHAVYPSLTTARDSIGHTHQGRAMWAMKISDNPGVDEDEPEFFINALIHAREPMGMEATVRFISHLLDNYGTDSLITYLVDNREFYFVPVVNPDGYEYNRQTDPYGGGMWRKNRRNNDGSYGVDLNRNWGYMWGYDDDGSSPSPYDETYRGPSAFSEPEIEAMRQYVNSHHFDVVMNFHTYGNYFLYAYGYDDIYSEDQPLFEVLGDTVTSFNGYAPGTAWELLYNTNGDAVDWQYGERTEKPKVFGFTIEIGDWFDGFWPDPDRIEPLWEGVLPALILLSTMAENLYVLGPPNPPVLYPIGVVQGDSFTVTWQHSDTLNPAVSYELREMTGMQELTDGFESETAYWTLDGFLRRSNRRHLGTYSLFSGSENSYTGLAAMANSYRVEDNDTLKFWTWYSIESNYDYAYVQISSDGGVTFANLEGNITTDFDPNGLNEGNGITGYSSSWRQAVFPIGAYSGQDVIMRFAYKTDGGTLMEGFYVDDVNHVIGFQQDIILSSNIQETHYDITGRAEGQYYYAVRARDAQSQLSSYSNREMADVQVPSAADDVVLPSGLSLFQNYPNPFNPATEISFSLPARAYVELAVYSITGAKIATLVDSDLNAGEHRVTFNGTDFAGGVYFYRLRAGDETLTKKMVFVK
jgi:hypothetical protein